MPHTTFSIFLDENVSSQVASHSITTHSRKCKVLCDVSAPNTKENVNPLTGLSFDSEPPLKKRKPSSSSALKVKPFPSSSKIGPKSKRLQSSNNSKDKGKKRAVLGTNGNRNDTDNRDGMNFGEAEQSQTALGNRRAYEFTVMPLANVTQAYDETEGTEVIASLHTLEDDSSEHNMSIDVLTENNIELCDVTSKKALPTQPLIATGA